MLENKEWMTSV